MIKIEIKDVQLVPVGEIKRNPKNRNKHPKEQIEELARHYEVHGMRTPIIVSNQSGQIVAGDGRFQAALKAGMKEVPVTYQDFETPEKEFSFGVADNGLSLWSELDLIGINDDLKDMPKDFDLADLGLKDFKVIDTEALEPGCDEDAVPEHVEPKTKPGDLYKLGNHRLLCGDSTSASDFDKLMSGEKAHLVFTDPPYGVDYQGGHNQKKRTGIKNDALAGQDLTDLFGDSLALACAHSEEHSAFYIWYANGKAVETFSSFAKLPLKVRAVLCWYKVKSGLGAFMSQYIPNYEPCIYAFKEGCSPQWFGPSDEKTVWELKKESKNEFHPTQKPVELSQRAIKNSSKEGDIVLDMFGGSGATLIGAEITNRHCFMMELDPKYCDVIVARWEKYTGQKAELISG